MAILAASDLAEAAAVAEHPEAAPVFSQPLLRVDSETQVLLVAVAAPVGQRLAMLVVLAIR